jgi:hypothetical protein
VAFDPDAFLSKYGGGALAAPTPAPVAGGAPGPAGSGFDPDAFLAKFGAPAAAAPAPAQPPPVSVLESVVRGAKQGGSMGFGDEITAGLEAAFTPKTYEQARDEERRADKAAQASHPIAYGAGEVGGGVATALIPGGGLLGAAKGAGLGTRIAVNAARGAGAGIVSGFGNTEKTDIPGMVQDAAKSGLVGAVTGGVLGTAGEELVRGAPKRVDERLIQTITGGRATTAGKKIYQNEDLVLNAARKFGLDKVAKDPEAFTAAAEGARKDVGEAIGKAYSDADAIFLGVKNKEVVSAIKATAQRFSSPVEAPIRKQIEALAKQTASQWGKAGERVPLAEVNNLVGKLEAIGFASADVAPGAAKQVQRDLAKNVEGVLQRRLGEIKQFAGNVKATPTAGNSVPLAQSASAADALENLTTLNKDYRGLKMITKMRGELAGVPPANRAAGGLRNIAANTLDTGLLLTHPALYAAKKIGGAAVKAGATAGDEILRNISLAAQGGKSTAMLVQKAIEAGIPRGTIGAALNATGIGEADDRR